MTETEATVRRGLVDKTAGVVGLAVSGAAAYAYLVLAGRMLGPADFAPIGTLWAAVFLVTAALVTPLEIAVARATAGASGRGIAIRPLLRAAASLVGAFGVVAVTGAILLGPWLGERLFADEALLVICGGVALAGLAAGAVAKGTCAGAGRLAAWGAYLVADGGARLLVAILLGLVAPTPASFAVALACGPWIALLAPLPALRRIVAVSGRAEAFATGSLARATAPLVVAGTASAILTYLGALMLPALVGDPTAAVGGYVAALSVARLPLFLISPVVAILVPRLAAETARGEIAATRRTAGAFGAVGAVGGVLVALAFALVGSGAVGSMFGAGFALDARSAIAIGIAAGCWVFATATTSVAIGVGRGGLAAIAWGVGVLFAVIGAAVAGQEAFLRTDAALAVGSVAAAAAAVIAARVALGRPGPVDLGEALPAP